MSCRQRRRLLRLQVADNGVGIPPEYMALIFSFAFTTKPHGHGFGLHASALAAKDMGGTLRADIDGYDRGTTFALRIPSQPSTSPRTSSPATPLRRAAEGR